MPLDPQVRAVLGALEAARGRPYEESTPEGARAAFVAVVSARRGPDFIPEPVGAVQERIIETDAGPVPVRVYRPHDEGPLPVVVFFHGGGWVIGDVDTHDAQARTIANASSAVVVSVDYRRAPEHPFPAALDDCFAATRWTFTHIVAMGGDPARLAVAGDSAGGNLAAAVALLGRDQGWPPLVAQLLIYPTVDATLSHPSVEENGEGYFLTAKTMRWYVDQYLPDPDQRRNPLASPLFTEDLTGLPPAIITTAEYDPLRDEGEAYARRLRDAGVSVTLSRYDGLIHGYFGMGPVVDSARVAVDESCLHLRSALRAQGP